MPDLVGQKLGQYQILERIARGATATVYKAYQEKLDRYVAIKVLSPHFIDEEGFLERFHQEARAVARLSHPNILPVYDFDQVGDAVFIVMKYVTTGTLKEVMTGPLNLRDVLEFTTQIGLALGYAHRQGVIHRDVKPSNILVADNNWALLTDFGLAKIRAMNRKLTASGMGVGTPDYIAPEQAQGRAVDGRTDLYSLGVMMYEMVTGCLPFEGESGMAVVVKHITEKPRSVREFQPDVPIAVDQVITKSLEKDPDRRYPTAESMIAALARAIGPQPEHTTQVTTVAREAGPIHSTRSRETQLTIVLRSRWESLTVNASRLWAVLRAQSRSLIEQARERLRPFGAQVPSVLQTYRRTIGIALGILLLMLIGLALVPAALQSSAARTPPQTAVAVQPDRSRVPSTPSTALTATLEATDAPTLAPPPPGMAGVPAGPFKMGGVNGKYDVDETPPHVVILNGFYIDEKEVTNAQFAGFVSATGYRTDAEKAGDKITWRTFNTPDRQRFPATYVSWDDAVRYCASAGKRLPTEAEWEKAARGTTPIVYPWGNDFNDSLVNTFERGAGQPVAVGSYVRSGSYGVYDMIGNVWEWVQDWYGAYSDKVQANPTGPGSGIQKVIRGGSFKTKLPDATTSARGKASVDGRSDDIGFRCAKSAS